MGRVIFLYQCRRLWTATVYPGYNAGWASGHNAVADITDLWLPYPQITQGLAGIYDNGSDEYMEGLSEHCEEVVKGEVPLEEQSELFRRLDDEFDLVENRREYIEEQMEEEAEEVVVN